MSNTVSFIKTNDGISLILNGKPYQVNRDHVNYAQICEALKVKSYDSIPELIVVAKAISKYIQMVDRSGLVVDEGQGIITYKGFEIHHTLVDRIFQMMKEGFDIKPLVNFLFNLFQNPSEKAIDELYTFLEYGKMPITDDGHFIAYKRVRSDYKSIHDGKTDNNIGMDVSMPRDQVNDNSKDTCSRGLHICSFDYLKEYSGDRVIIVKVNPANVVSIPTDYSSTKARVCHYTVIGELSLNDAGLPTNSLAAKSVYMEDEEQQDWDEESDEECEDWDKQLEMDMTDSEYEAHQIVKTELQAGINKLKSVWFQFGYSNGYLHGKNKLPAKDDAVKQDFVDVLSTLNKTESDLVSPISDFEIQAVNEGYPLGYKHGKGHKKRQYPDMTVLPFDFK